MERVDRQLAVRTQTGVLANLTILEMKIMLI
ncbi:hypothetical protein MiSe_55600 [Microseira wollei NIES-4236]|uniref:Transposase n=1 Tax=Microseira wollei NIES-4236 TaxID=2530354 RepID=A0AAV3WK14_9CYAN|nr:hypothetical protein MiSe_55600 [Microseira wollei NIES-4236]